MEYLGYILVGLFFWCLIFGCFGSWVAEQKSRSISEGFGLGCLFGPLGVIVEALLPVPPGTHSAQHAAPELIAPAPKPVARVRTAAEIEAQRENQEWIQKRNAEQEAAMADWLQKKAEREAKQLERENAAKEERDAKLIERGVKPGPFAWFWLLPDLTQALLAALFIAVPLVGIIVTLFRSTAWSL